MTCVNVADLPVASTAGSVAPSSAWRCDEIKFRKQSLYVLRIQQLVFRSLRGLEQLLLAYQG